jgi:CRP/FNR family transcriptional regulator
MELEIMNEEYSKNLRRMFKAIPYFTELDEAGLRAVERSAILREFQTGQLVLLEGEPCFGLYVIESGWLKASKLGIDGREQVLQILGPGESFNAVGVFTDTPNPATVTALEPARIWIFHREMLEELLHENPTIARHVIEDLASRIQHLVSLVEDLSLRSVTARLARLLLDRSEEGIMQRQRWATQTELASHIGTVPEVLNRALRKLSEEGVIKVERDKIAILDPARIEEEAQNP